MHLITSVMPLEERPVFPGTVSLSFAMKDLVGPETGPIMCRGSNPVKVLHSMSLLGSDPPSEESYLMLRVLIGISLHNKNRGCYLVINVSKTRAVMTP